MYSNLTGYGTNGQIRNKNISVVENTEIEAYEQILVSYNVFKSGQLLILD